MTQANGGWQGGRRQGHTGEKQNSFGAGDGATVEVRGGSTQATKGGAPNGEWLPDVLAAREAEGRKRNRSLKTAGPRVTYAATTVAACWLVFPAADEAAAPLAAGTAGAALPPLLTMCCSHSCCSCA